MPGETNTNDGTRIAELESALQAKDKELGMVREENNLRRLRDMRLATTQMQGSHGGSAVAAPPPDPLDKELEELDPKARSIVERLVSREAQRAIAPVLDELGGIKNVQLAQANYQQIVRHFPEIESVARDVAAEIDQLPPNERETVLRSPYAIALIGRKIHAEKFKGAGGAPNTGKPGDARGAIRSRAVGESATTGLTHEIGASGDDPAIRRKIAETHPLSPEWAKVKEQMRAERRARGIR